MSTPSQDYSATITWISDWTAHLAANGLTISSATVTCPTQPAGGTVTITGGNPATVTGGKLVTFKVSQAGLTVPTTVVLVVTATLSNGDTDQRDFPIQFTNT